MTTNNQETRNTILNVVKKMIEDDMDLNNLTVRQIADRAGVGVGMINYYFKSKDNLISTVLGDIMSNMVSDYFMQKSNTEMEPVLRLKAMLTEMYAFGEKYEKYINYLIAHTLLDGDMGAQLMLIPTLKDIFPSKDEFELRIIALQILLPLQITSINPESFRLYSGIDLRNINQRTQYIAFLIDNVTKPKNF